MRVGKKKRADCFLVHSDVSCLSLALAFKNLLMNELGYV